MAADLDGPPAGRFTMAKTGGGRILRLAGDWVVAAAQPLDDSLAGLRPEGGETLDIDLAGIGAMDTLGAWLVHRTAVRWAAAGGQAKVIGATEQHQVLLGQVAKADKPGKTPPPSPGLVVRVLEHVGMRTVLYGQQTLDLVAFLGATIAALLRVTLVNPARFRLTATVAQMQAVGVEAMPIVGLISFLIGVVIAYQGVDQLRTFGAEIFVVDLVGISILRELGILLAAIVIAGRSGSAFTAQIGAMKLNEEIDAMRTLGLDPIEVLVLPRVLALVIMLPALAFFADMLGLLGGMLMSWINLGIPPELFISRLASRVAWTHYLIGIIKAPFFALTIAVVGCHEGLLVEGSSTSVGRHTTLSVVKAIFLVIVLDAFFSIFFAAVDL